MKKVLLPALAAITVVLALMILILSGLLTAEVITERETYAWFVLLYPQVQLVVSICYIVVGYIVTRPSKKKEDSFSATILDEFYAVESKTTIKKFVLYKDLFFWHNVLLKPYKTN